MDRIAGGDVRIGGWVPALVIGAVEEAGQHWTAGTQQAVESGAILRRLDFLGISRTHGRQGIAENESALQVADVAEELQLVGMKQRRRQADLRQHGGRVEAAVEDRKSTRLNSSHLGISYAVFCL